MRRHRGDVRWREVMAATPAWVFAEAHRDKKRHRKAWSLFDWTVTGLTKPKRKKKRKEAPESLWGRIGNVMGAFGGGNSGDRNR